MALEEEEAKATPHSSETVGWLAIEAGRGNWSGHAYEAARTPNAVTQRWYRIPFGQSFGQAPRFIAAVGTYDGPDSAHLRYKRGSLTPGGVEVMVEEDTTGDNETAHTTEEVNNLALERDGVLRGRVFASGGRVVTKYYYVAGQRVAQRWDGVVYYLHTDHFGSTSLARMPARRRSNPKKDESY